MITPLLLGAGFGLGLLALYLGIRPRAPSLAESLAALGQPPIVVVPDTSAGFTAKAGRPFVPLLEGLGLPGAGIRADLAVLDCPPERHLAEKAAAALTGILILPATAFLLAAGGVTVSWTLPLWGALALGVVAFFVPDLAVKTQAAERRAAFRHALGTFLDLVVISLAGGAGVDAALTHAAGAGTGQEFTRIRQALQTARINRQPPWITLRQLGRDLGITELTELAASLNLAGSEGAKVRASLAAKAAALRTRQLADAETTAQAATERMSLPVAGLFAGFLLLLGYPAVINVLTGL